ETLKSCVRPTDCIARYGGDEFAILFQGVTLEIAKMVTERMRDKVASTNFDSQGVSKVAVTLSLGLAVAETTDTPESVFRKADAALYRSKQAGRNRLTVFTPEAAETLLSDCPERDLTPAEDTEHETKHEPIGV
ncbi:MAG: GGDEF domain-containing protein, partial [Planctomycetales bacterium]|nr:GGDEF domain-containing protein [Planctomycetales bacterium]